MFNYFKELYEKCDKDNTVFHSYKIVNLNGNIVYVEGQNGILTLSDELISCKLKKGILEIKGNNLKIRELANTTLLVEGKIYKLEVL